MDNYVYVVQDRHAGWDNITGTFTNEEYVYSIYDNDRYIITPQKLDNTELAPIPNAKHKYRYEKVFDIKCEDNYVSTFRVKRDGAYMKTYNIIDPETEMHIEIGGTEQPHDVDVLSLVADNFCEITGMDKDNIIIFEDKDENLYLGTTKEYEDSVELWTKMKEKGTYVWC